MFFRRKAPPITLTNDAYVRWLRAQRPPFEWFLELGELEQEQLAQHGDDQWAAVAEAIAAELGGGQQPGPAEPQEDDAAIAVKAAAQVLKGMGMHTSRPTPRPTFAGFGEEKAKTPDDGKPKRSFLDRMPDGKEVIK